MSSPSGIRAAVAVSQDIPTLLTGVTQTKENRRQFRGRSATPGSHETLESVRQRASAKCLTKAARLRTLVRGTIRNGTHVGTCRLYL
jgi:hypothetical protein